jgi:hypothetical protein
MTTRGAGAGNSRRRAPAADVAARASRFIVLGLVAGACCMSGCSWHQAYDMAQGWQRNACFRIMDAQERDRCVAGTGMAYEDYQRQTQTNRNDK